MRSWESPTAPVPPAKPTGEDGRAVQSSLPEATHHAARTEAWAKSGARPIEDRGGTWSTVQKGQAEQTLPTLMQISALRRELAASITCPEAAPMLCCPLALEGTLCDRGAPLPKGSSA